MKMPQSRPEKGETHLDISIWTLRNYDRQVSRKLARNSKKYHISITLSPCGSFWTNDEDPLFEE
jgi:hypothetical protein